MKLTKIYTDFTENEKTSGIVLIICTIFSIALANSSYGDAYIDFFHYKIFSKPIEFLINDGLMTIFFLVVGLEIKREIYVGELSNIKKAMLPILCALGGMLMPAFIHYLFNNGLDSVHGYGIPMATDIAFSLAVLSILGKRVPTSLKIFLTALAIVDDLGAIVVIALFYTANFSLFFLSFSLLILALMFLLNYRRVTNMWVYLFFGAFLWYLMYKSGIHPTITGVLVAFAIPFATKVKESPSEKLERVLHKPVSFLILPLFALANTAILLPDSIIHGISNPNAYGIMAGLLLGKPIGILGFAALGTLLGISSLPNDFKKIHLMWTGFLAGIGFTMSIFITMLAFSPGSENIVDSKIAIIVASFFAGLIGFLGLHFTLKPAKHKMKR